MSALKNVVAHGKARLLEQNKLIVVPEWGDENGPLEFYVRPATIKEISHLDNVNQKEGSIPALVDEIILRARDSDGKNIFRRVERGDFIRYGDPAVLLRVISEMNGEDEPELTQEDAEKN